MDHNTTRYMESIVYCLCLICALVLTFWCVSEYAKNNEISEVSFHRFNSNEEEQQYPSMTLCVADSYKEFEFSKFNDSSINSKLYSKFLAGKHWNIDMFSVEYDLVTIDIRDYIIGSCMLTIDASSDCHEFSHIEHYARINNAGVRKCFSFKFDAKGTIDETFIAINNSMYPNGVRPTQIGRLLIMFHYPDQIITALKNIFYKWPLRHDPMDEYYSMLFSISNVEILKRRRNGREECHDWKHYDSTTIEDVMRSVGCRPPYWKSRLDLPPCRSQKELTNLGVQYRAKKLQEDKFQKYVPPCIEITKMDVKFEEELGENAHSGYDEIYERFIRQAGTTRGWFVINTSLWQSPSFKNIREIRAYSIQSMIGNSGGYIGLLVGVTISDLFCLALKIYFTLKGMFLNYKTSIVKLHSTFMLNCLQKMYNCFLGRLFGGIFHRGGKAMKDDSSQHNQVSIEVSKDEKRVKTVSEHTHKSFKVLSVL